MGRIVVYTSGLVVVAGGTPFSPISWFVLVLPVYMHVTGPDFPLTFQFVFH